MGWFDDANILTDNVQFFVLLTMKTANDGRTKGNRNQDGPPNKWVVSEYITLDRSLIIVLGINLGNYTLASDLMKIIFINPKS